MPLPEARISLRGMFVIGGGNDFRADTPPFPPAAAEPHLPLDELKVIHPIFNQTVFK